MKGQPDVPPKPLPAPTPLSVPFWRSAAEGRLCLQRCVDCGHIRFPLGPVCTECLSERTEWAELSGRGKVLAHLVFHQTYHSAWHADSPYSVIQVQLDEGPCIFSNVDDPTHADTETDLVGKRVEAVFETVAEDIGLHRFRIVD